MFLPCFLSRQNPIFVLILTTHAIMKHASNRTWEPNRPTWKARLTFDYTTALGSLAAALLAYIVYHIYPLVTKGLLW